MRTANETPGRLAKEFTPAQEKTVRGRLRTVLVRRHGESIEILLEHWTRPSLTTPRIREFTQSSDADDAATDNHLRWLEALLPGLEHVPIVHGGVVMAIQKVRERRAADLRRRDKVRAQYRNALALGPVRTPRRPQARARRVRCATVARHQADSGGSDEGDGDGPPAGGPLGPPRGRGSHGAVPSSPARLALRFAPSAASPRRKDGTERRTLQRRHRRQGGAELRGTAYRLDTRSPFQPIDAPEAPQVETGASGVGGAAPLSYGLCAETRQQVGRSVPLLARGLVCCGPRSWPASQISRGQSSNGGAKC
jgi:hypothetical protein